MTLTAFAFAAGALATVNPCGFAILPAFLAYYLGEDDEDNTPGGQGLPDVFARVTNGFLVGLAVTGGFVAVFSVAGLVVSLGLRALVGFVPWAAVVIGAGLVVAGLAMLSGRRVALNVGRDFAPGEGRSYRRMFAFGAGYAIASLSCTLAVLLAVIAQALATSNPAQMVGVFTAYALGTGTVLIALTVSAALAKAAVARVVRRLLPVIGRVGGAVLVASGAYLIAYWLPNLTGSTGNQPTGRINQRFSAPLMAFLDANIPLLAAAGGILTLVGATLAIHHHHRRPALHGPIAASACSPDTTTDPSGTRPAHNADDLRPLDYSSPAPGAPPSSTTRPEPVR